MEDIEYEIFSPDDPWYPITLNGTHTFVAPTWVHSECDAEDAARAVVETHFTNDDWREWFGEDDSATVLLQIHKPGYLRGFYLMTMEMEIKATATSIEDPRPQTVTSE